MDERIFQVLYQISIQLSEIRDILVEQNNLLVKIERNQPNPLDVPE